MKRWQKLQILIWLLESPEEAWRADKLILDWGKHYKPEYQDEVLAELVKDNANFHFLDQALDLDALRAALKDAQDQNI